MKIVLDDVHQMVVVNKSLFFSYDDWKDYLQNLQKIRHPHIKVSKLKDKHLISMLEHERDSYTLSKVLQASNI